METSILDCPLCVYDPVIFMMGEMVCPPLKKPQLMLRLPAKVSDLVLPISSWI